MINKHLEYINNKIISSQDLNTLVSRWKFENQKIVFTNGCFDLIHYGHIDYLSQAKSLGDKLIIGMNSSQSVSRLKGNHRPIKDEQSRLYILASLQFIDAVVTFEEDTPYNLIERILPNILVKGGDWKVESIIGADLVLENGGEVKSLPFVSGYSTTNLEDKIRNQ